MVASFYGPERQDYRKLKIEKQEEKKYQHNTNYYKLTDHFAKKKKTDINLSILKKFQV